MGWDVVSWSISLCVINASRAARRRSIFSLSPTAIALHIGSISASNSRVDGGMSQPPEQSGKGDKSLLVCPSTPHMKAETARSHEVVAGARVPQLAHLMVLRIVQRARLAVCRMSVCGERPQAVRTPATPTVSTAWRLHRLPPNGLRV